MENNFFVGNVVHKNKKGNNLYSEKIVLYTCDNVYFIDLLTDNTYTTNSENRDYVVYDSLVPTNSEEFRIDYDICLLNIMKLKIKRLEERNFSLKNKKINY